MPDFPPIVLTVLILLVALLYSSVGHAGASGYLAIMALVGLSSQWMKSSSLVLNILVATITTVQFVRAGCFSWRLLWPFAITSIPLAYLGGRIVLSGTYYKPLVGLLLLYAAIRLFTRPTTATKASTRLPPQLHIAMLVGAAIGILSGLTGTGGGIFLTPILVLANWADPRRAAGTSAPFILVNSASGLLGLASTGISLPPQFIHWAAAAVIGGLIGSHLGSRTLNIPILRRALAVVLTIAAAKLIVLR